jgi:hypothetical protein
VTICFFLNMGIVGQNSKQKSNSVAEQHRHYKARDHNGPKRQLVSFPHKWPSSLASFGTKSTMRLSMLSMFYHEVVVTS